MKINIPQICSLALALPLLAGLASSSVAQEVSIPDPGLNAAVRDALQKPTGPLTETDMLGLTFLSACCRNISSIQGLESARNLTILDLHSNSLTNCVVPATLTNLSIIDLFQNQLTNFVLPAALSNITIVDLAFNSLPSCSLPNGLTKLDTVFAEGNQLTNFILPTGLSRLTQLDLSGNALAALTVPPDMTNVNSLSLFANQFTNVTLPVTLGRLAFLDLDFNQLRGLTLPAGLTNLNRLTVFQNQLTDLMLPPDMTRLTFLDAGNNQLNDFIVPVSMTQLNFLRLSNNRLTRFALPPGLTNLTGIFLRSNQLTNLSLSAGMTQLLQIDVSSNQLAMLTLPPDMTQLVTLGLDGNPLTTLILSDPLAATNLAGTVVSLRNQGVSVLTYPLAVQLAQPQKPAGIFQFGILGPPGIYAVLGSTNLKMWNEIATATNKVGSVVFNDVADLLSPKKFYRARQTPSDMMFIPPNTFIMGSPTNEQDREFFEGPQATVTLTHGFWIGKFEVTQGEYLAVVGNNPSDFPGDLSRPISSVNWDDATNYCAKLTQRELVAGRIPAGSVYRLPTEAEWECAARAGTTTRFSYGDDPTYGSLTNYAWFLDFANIDLTVHPAGSKLPNPWGLYDVHGQVWEWCQDWYGNQTGGVQIDPTGPVSDPQGRKVIRGGAYDYPNSSCRSAARFFRFATWPDSDVGFRVVLVTGQ